MDLYTRVSQFKSAALKRIEEAAQKGDTASIFSNTRTVEEVERIKSKLDELLTAIDSLEKNAGSSSYFEKVAFHTVQGSNNSNISEEELSPREKGELQRKKFIHELQTSGITLTRRKGSTYKTKNQSFVGIAYASERLSNRWFLGLPHKTYHAIVLLCERRNGNLLKFILPRNIFQSNEGHFSEVNGHLKFNVLLNGEEYYMPIPNAGHLTLNSFLDNYASLRVL